jgi:hypothetical protein
MYAKTYPFVERLPTEPISARSISSEGACQWLPGYPDLEVEYVEPLSAFLVKELECEDLERLSAHLWLMSTQSSANISPLHRQKVKGRDIIVTEEPKLHLIWFYDRIHVKPMPAYLLSRSFWQDCLLDPQKPLGSMQNRVLTNALGFLRSYAHLIQYESDFRIAKDRALALLPGYISWEQWRLLRAKLLVIRDEDVSGRFRFGEIRLTRLNFWSKLLLSKAYYHRTHRQYGDYFASFYPPLLFLFGIVSMMLGAMQLAATVEQYDGHWRGLLGYFRLFSAVVVTITLVLLASLVGIFAYKIIKEWVYALRCRYLVVNKKTAISSKP